jgi:hypothetical protein
MPRYVAVSHRHGAFRLEGSDVVTVAVAVRIGDPPPVDHEVIAPGAPQAVTLELDDEPPTVS